MERLIGKHQTEITGENLKKIGDLVFFEGPLLSVFSNLSKDIYIYNWVESDERYNRWLVYQITADQLSKYLSGNCSHRELIENPVDNIIVSVDFDNELKEHNILRLSPFSLPDMYLPKPHVKHDADYCPHESEIRDFCLRKKSFKGVFRSTMNAGKVYVYRIRARRKIGLMKKKRRVKLFNTPPVNRPEKVSTPLSPLNSRK